MTAQQLKNSILQMAVQGKLVPQDPSDEPASVLLERIRAEKEQLIKQKKIKKEKNPSYIFRGADNTPYEKIGDDIVPLDAPFEIPDSWEWVRLGYICEIARGGSPRPIQQYLTTEPNGINWIKIGDSDKGGKYINSTKEKIIPAGVSKSRMVYAGDFLLTNSMSFGRPYILNVDGCIHDGWLVLSRYQTAYDQEFLYYLLSSSFAYYQFCGVVSGAVVKNLNSDKVAAAVFPLPPMEEQRRIVNAIKGVEPSLLWYAQQEGELTVLNTTFPEKLRKSILQWAIQGKLVPQNENDEPAEVLLERIRAEREALIKAGKTRRDKHESIIFRRDNSHYEKLDGIERCIDDEIPFDLPESWEWVRFFSVVDIATNLVRPEVYAGYMHIAPDNIEKATGVLFECHTVQQDKVASPNHLFYKGQIIYSKIRPLLRKAVIAPFDGLCSADMYPLNTSINKEYLLRYMLSDAFNLQVAAAMSSRVKMPKINQDELSNILIPIPPIQEQERIISRIEELFNKIMLI